HGICRALRYCLMIYGQYTLGMNVPGASSPADMRDNLKSKAPTKRRSRAIAAEDGTLTDRAYRELEEMIVTLRLSPGTVLSEQALAVRLKIGRTPVREALPRLARGGVGGVHPRA